MPAGLPRVVVSRCLGFDACRYDGGIVESPQVGELRGRVEFIAVCPEADIGLGVPRRPINLHSIDGLVRVIQEETGRDLTDQLQGYSEETLGNAGRVDAFILKARSPSCGLGTASLIRAEGDVSPASGVFAAEARRRFPSGVFVDEEELGRLGVEGFLSLIGRPGPAEPRP